MTQALNTALSQLSMVEKCRQLLDWIDEGEILMVNDDHTGTITHDGLDEDLPHFEIDADYLGYVEIDRVIFVEKIRSLEWLSHQAKDHCLLTMHDGRKIEFRSFIQFQCSAPEGAIES